MVADDFLVRVFVYLMPRVRTSQQMGFACVCVCKVLIGRPHCYYWWCMSVDEDVETGPKQQQKKQAHWTVTTEEMNTILDGISAYREMNTS